MAVRQQEMYPFDPVGLDRATVRAKSLSEQFGYSWIIRRHVNYLIYVGNKSFDQPMLKPNCPDIEMSAAFMKGNRIPHKP